MAQISKRGMGVAPQNPAPQLPKFDPVFQGAILQISQSMNHMIRLVRSAGFEEGGFVWTRFGITPPKINIELENDGLEDDFPFPGVYSQVPC